MARSAKQVAAQLKAARASAEARKRLYAKSGRDVPTGRNPKRKSNKTDLTGRTSTDWHRKQMKTKGGKAYSRKKVDSSFNAMKLARSSGSDPVIVTSPGVPKDYMSGALSRSSVQLRLPTTKLTDTISQAANLAERTAMIKSARAGIKMSYYARSGPGATSQEIMKDARNAGKRAAKSIKKRASKRSK